MSENIKQYVPKHRLDNFHIEELYQLKDSDIKIISYELLVWLKDMSQPISKELVPLLILKHNGLSESIIKIFDDLKEDSILKYNIINYVLKELSDNDLKIYSNSLNRIVEKPTKYEKFYETNIVAKEILKR